MAFLCDRIEDGCLAGTSPGRITLWAEMLEDGTIKERLWVFVFWGTEGCVRAAAKRPPKSCCGLSISCGAQPLGTGPLLQPTGDPRPLLSLQHHLPHLYPAFKMLKC